MDFTYELTLESTFYLWGGLLLLPLWLYGFLKSKDSRKEMLLCGILFGFASIVIGYFYAIHDYWNPPYIFNNVMHIEDFIYGFLVGGISSEIYEIITGKEDSKRRKKRRYSLVIVFLVISVLSFLIMVNLLKWNSIVAHIVPPFIVALFVITLRKDLIKPVFISGLLMVIITFVWQSIIHKIYPNAVADVWILENLSNILINGIPLEELLFALSLGLGASSFYELILGYEYRKK